MKPAPPVMTMFLLNSITIKTIPIYNSATKVRQKIEKKRKRASKTAKKPKKECYKRLKKEFCEDFLLILQPIKNTVYIVKKSNEYNKWNQFEII